MLEHCHQGRVCGRVTTGAVMAQAAAGHDRDVIRMQGHCHLVQHADHGLALRHQGTHDREPLGLVGWVEIGQRPPPRNPAPPTRASPGPDTTPEAAVGAAKVAGWVGGRWPTGPSTGAPSAGTTSERAGSTRWSSLPDT